MTFYLRSKEEWVQSSFTGTVGTNIRLVSAYISLWQILFFENSLNDISQPTCSRTMSVLSRNIVNINITINHHWFISCEKCTILT